MRGCDVYMFNPLPGCVVVPVLLSCGSNSCMMDVEPLTMLTTLLTTPSNTATASTRPCVYMCACVCLHACLCTFVFVCPCVFNCTCTYNTHTHTVNHHTQHTAAHNNTAIIHIHHHQHIRHHRHKITINTKSSSPSTTYTPHTSVSVISTVPGTSTSNRHPAPFTPCNQPALGGSTVAPT